MGTAVFERSPHERRARPDQVLSRFRLAPPEVPIGFEPHGAHVLARAARNAYALGFDAAELTTIGASAGGGLAAGITLLARNEGRPALAGQIAMYGMLDERNDSVTARQIDGLGIWDHTSNDTGWDLYLGGRRRTDRVTPYESPSRAADRRGLPPTYIEVGSADVVRDENVALAEGIWADGGDAELHVWPGGYHLFELLAPDAELSRQAKATRGASLA